KCVTTRFKSACSFGSGLGAVDMKPDLLYAQAYLDWAVSKLPSLQQRLEDWLYENVKAYWADADNDPLHHLIVAVEKEPFPLSFSVEPGLLIHAMRSALDLVARAAFKRDTLLHPRDGYF